MTDVRLTRRELLAMGATTTAGAVAALTPLPAHATAREDHSRALPVHESTVSLEVNGRPLVLQVDNRGSLLDVLREQLRLTGTKKGCDQGQCGACTILVDGRRINSCLTLAVMFEGASITTIEGIGTAAQAHPLQRAFVKHDGYQCGYCTPGQICSAIGALDEIERGVPSFASDDPAAMPERTEPEIRERMSGNLCRCGAYPNIVAAILESVET
ncbi:2Fe-2S iron-sulfur cluster binding domain-containing protein [Stenotrophomonas sp. Sa5BUN4]|uniref:2Fe-2S iron-sulfur cluster binding domain-containing protein n=1 Tax=Stenotrophomonas lacuserhaii TaxID=2760084 RepID=A0A8X8K136_9GAMM|nr:2Fe-2S iron-sulfur cluster-binding protein [Stenotrophomonas pennii]MBD7952989.1 2Fe-2S iron-sulfur cluster binding domain-containing protein [Stenotrophomonas pennii]